jgi:drug/metabolite transporter (DMT)-like permease
MTIFLFSIVLFAAALHAGWNAIVKSAGDPLLSTRLIAASGSLIAICILPFLHPPARESWPFIAASTVFQVGYFVLLARSYRLLDMSLAYPLMRGPAPVLVALAGVFLMAQPLSIYAWCGIIAICVGTLSMVADARGRITKSRLGLALMNAFVIAAYTLIDGLGVRRSGSPVAYTLWIIAVPGAALTAASLIGQRGTFVRYVSQNWRLGLLGGAGSTGSYAIALWAMTRAPISVVASLRETSIVFGTAISGALLRERVSRTRFVAVCIIAGGAALIRLGGS